MSVEGGNRQSIDVLFAIILFTYRGSNFFKNDFLTMYTRGYNPSTNKQLRLLFLRLNTIMNIWLLRKHPSNPFGEFQSKGRGYLSAFTVAGTYTDRDACLRASVRKNKKMDYLYTVKKLSKENT